MRHTINVICASFILCSCATAQNKPLLKDLLKHAREVQLPEELYEAYAAFVKAVETGDQGEIKKHCLPHSVTFTTEPRPEKGREYGRDMNIPFLKNGFYKNILSLRKDSTDTFLIRTGSSYMWFVKTKSEGWKLYRYGDKPIE